RHRGKLQVVLGAHGKDDVADALSDLVLGAGLEPPLVRAVLHEVVETVAGDVLPQSLPTVETEHLTKEVHEPIRRRRTREAYAPGELVQVWLELLEPLGVVCLHLR